MTSCAVFRLPGSVIFSHVLSFVYSVDVVPVYHLENSGRISKIVVTLSDAMLDVVSVFTASQGISADPPVDDYYP